MIVEFRENKRTLRGKNANRKYRYTRRVVLKCEICGLEREVNCTRKDVTPAFNAGACIVRQIRQSKHIIVNLVWQKK